MCTYLLILSWICAAIHALPRTAGKRSSAWSSSATPLAAGPWQTGSLRTRRGSRSVAVSAASVSYRLRGCTYITRISAPRSTYASRCPGAEALLGAFEKSVGSQQASSKTRSQDEPSSREATSKFTSRGAETSTGEHEQKRATCLFRELDVTRRGPPWQRSAD